MVIFEKRNMFLNCLNQELLSVLCLWVHVCEYVYVFSWACTHAKVWYTMQDICLTIYACEQGVMPIYTPLVSLAQVHWRRSWKDFHHLEFWDFWKSKNISNYRMKFKKCLTALKKTNMQYFGYNDALPEYLHTNNLKV